MSRSDFDRKDGAELSCQLLAARALRRNSAIVLRHQSIKLAGKTVAETDIKTCLYVHCMPSASLIRDAETSQEFDYDQRR
jgi:hypothetical protein